MGDLLNRAAARLQELAKTLSHWSVIAFLAVAVGSHAFYWSTVYIIDRETKGWRAERHPLDPMDAQLCEGKEQGPCHRLLEQTEIAERRGEHHATLMRAYQIHYFGQLATAYWAGTLAAVLLVLIAKRGWDDIDDKVKGLFLGLTMSAAFFGGFPSLTKAQQNVQDNKKAYIAYDNLCVEVRSYLVADDRPEVLPSAFVHEVDGKLQELNNVYFDLDESKVDLGRTRLLESQPKE